MATYAIGDLQGCHAELEQLLSAIHFDASVDQLWFAGDLVNRGPASLACLRTVRGLGRSAISVLGNHDLHLLAVALGDRRHLKRGDTLTEILDAPDAAELIDWLRYRPLAHYDPTQRAAIVHAGCPPEWTLVDLLDACHDVETRLRHPDPARALAQMYGNEPSRFADAQSAEARVRFTINATTRMRYVHANGALDFRCKGPLGSQGEGLLPWFDHPHFARRALPPGHRLLFGHWAALDLPPARASALGIVPLDTGCVWGRSLTAYRLEDGAYFSVPAISGRRPSA